MIGKIFGIDVNSLQKVYWLVYRLNLLKKKEKKEKKRDRGRKISMTYLRADLNSLRWEAITEKTIIYKTTVDK